MPKELEAKLKRQARKKGFGEERTGAYVYGTLRKTGWTPSTQKAGVASHTDPIAKKAINKLPKV
jgi:hypothetical protein